MRFAQQRYLMSAGAKVAELVDALDLGSSGVTRESSSLSFRTSQMDTGFIGARLLKFQ